MGRGLASASGSAQRSRRYSLRNCVFARRQDARFRERGQDNKAVGDVTLQLRIVGDLTIWAGYPTRQKERWTSSGRQTLAAILRISIRTRWSSSNYLRLMAQSTRNSFDASSDSRLPAPLQSSTSCATPLTVALRMRY